jgi:hypothetical protein
LAFVSTGPSPQEKEDHRDHLRGSWPSTEMGVPGVLVATVIGVTNLR